MEIVDDFGEDPYYKEYYEKEVKNSEVERFCATEKLHESSNKCCVETGVSWKESVQRYYTNQLLNDRATQKFIRNGTYSLKPVYEFTISERGRPRGIKSHHISDRVVFNSVTNNVLLPSLSKYLIYDNGASLKNKGLGFSRMRFEIDLRNAYAKYGENTYILLIDFSKYFDNIQHQIVYNYLSQYLNPAELEFIKICFKEFEIDVSYMNDEEYLYCMNTLFNVLEYSSIDKSLLTGEKIMCKSIGIGSQLSQIIGVYYPHEIDNYCKIVKGIKEYGRYCDDSYVMAGSIKELQQIYSDICIIANKLGIFINHKKTRIQKVNSETISFLKINYIVTPTGGLVRKVNSDTFHRERRRIIKFKHLLDNGRMELNDIILCYKSWRGTYDCYDSGYEIYKLDLLFMSTFHLDKNFQLIKMEE